MLSIADIRKEYKLKSLSESEVLKDPFLQFEKRWEELLRSGVEEANAMTLATASNDGVPSARIVLLKGVDERGFIFFTNYDSHKGRELAENPNASLVFYWQQLERQICIAGPVEKISREESGAYFKTRPR